GLDQSHARAQRPNASAEKDWFGHGDSSKRAPDLQSFLIYSKRPYKSPLANALNFRKFLQLRRGGCHFASPNGTHRLAIPADSVSRSHVVPDRPSSAKLEGLTMTAQPFRSEPGSRRLTPHQLVSAKPTLGLMGPTSPQRLEVRPPMGKPVPAGTTAVLTTHALAFVADLVERFAPSIRDLLAARAARRARLERGEDRLDFLPETRAIREAVWTVAPAPHDLRRRVVEITAPVDRKMMINAFNSGADVFMADFEDACAPPWRNIIDGQVNLRDAVRGAIAFDDLATGKSYRVSQKRATLVVRPRGLHLDERHLLLDAEPVPAALVDFGLYFFHNAHALIERGTGPYFYLPKIESHREARLWNDVFLFAQDVLGIPRGTIRATVLIETLPAAFEMDEILWELREHASGLNCGRRDYIFRSIKMPG